MLDDIRKSIQNVLRERITSPLSGAFFFSWVIWNWKLLYTLVALDESIGISQRIEIVEVRYLSFSLNLLYPALTALFLILIYPFATTGALIVWLKFRKWQLDLRNTIEQKQLLTLEQSLQLRLELRNQEDTFDKLLKSKNEEISVLKSQLSQLQTESQNQISPAQSRQAGTSLDYEVAYRDMLNDSSRANAFGHLVERIQAGVDIPESVIAPRLLAYFSSHDIISKIKGQHRAYEFTDKGKYFVRLYTDGKK